LLRLATGSDSSGGDDLLQTFSGHGISSFGSRHKCDLTIREA
jgi:hypothetical protein